MVLRIFGEMKNKKCPFVRSLFTDIRGWSDPGDVVILEGGSIEVFLYMERGYQSRTEKEPLKAERTGKKGQE